MNVTYSDESRIGDHIWYISDTRKFQKHYPGWSYAYDLEETLQQIYDGMVDRFRVSEGRVA
jgi:CDP-paratose 2-epimerase